MQINGYEVVLYREDYWKVKVDLDEAGDGSAEEIFFAAKEKVGEAIHRGTKGRTDIEHESMCTTFAEIYELVLAGS